MTMQTCPQCGGSDLASATFQAGADARVVIAGQPDGFLGVVPYTKSPVRAVVCRGCGYIMLFATQLSDLLALEPDGENDVGL